MFNRTHSRGNNANRGQSSGRSFGRPSFSNNNRRARFAPKQLDTRLFVRPAIENAEQPVVEITHAFTDFKLADQILTNLTNKGYVTPTAIQDMALEPAIEGRDIIGLADTGTGKTAAFSLPIINKILQDPGQNALIIAPTRELAVQIRDEIRTFSERLPVYSCLVIGGSDIRRQMNDLQRQPHIIIGTPGRIKDLFDRRALKFTYVETVVLDEMDRMLDMGFVKDITEIMNLLPKQRQTLLFSATMDSKVESIAMQFLNNPLKISVKTAATAQNVEQNIIRASGKAQKLNVLTDLLRKEAFAKVLVFGRTKYGVEELSVSLINSGFSAGAIHGDKRQSQREQVLRNFKTNKINILIATDVAARGIDVKDITHVINFDQPATYDDYIHRVGRTGRAGKKGIALTFVD